MAPQGGPGHSATQPLSDDVERKTRKDGSPQTERTARPYPAQRLREGKAPRTPCARSADGDAMAEVGKVAGEGRGRENAVRFRSGKSKIPMDVSSSVWSTKRSGQGRREPTQTLLYVGQPCEPTQGTRPNRREGAAANASPQTRGGGRTNEW